MPYNLTPLPSVSLQFSFFYVLSFILILTGVFIYNLRQPSTARKKRPQSNFRQRRGRRGRNRGDEEEEEEEEEKREVLSELRRAFFESQTYEMSDSKETTPRPGRNHHYTNSYHHPDVRLKEAAPSGPTSQPNLVGKLASKLASKLPSRPTPTDQSGMGSSSKQRLRTFEDLAEENKDEDYFGASREGLIRERRSSSGSYGSTDKQTAVSAAGGPTKRTRHLSGGPPAESAE